MTILYCILFIVIIVIYIKRNKIIEGLDNGTYYITGSNRNRNCADEGNNIKCDRPWVQDWEKYTIRKYGDQYALIGGRNRKFCTYDGDRMRCDRSAWNSWEKFRINEIGGGKYSIWGGRDNKYCADTGDKIECNRSGVGAWEQFKITRILTDAEKRAAEQRAREESCRIELLTIRSRLTKLEIELIPLERTKTFMGDNYYSNYDLDKFKKNVDNFNDEYNKLESNLIDLDTLNKTQIKALNEIKDLAPTKMKIGLRSQLINTDFDNLS